MRDRRDMTRWARTTLLLGGVLLALVAFRGGSTGFSLAIDERGVALNLSAASINIMFDSGHLCSKTDICRMNIG